MDSRAIVLQPGSGCTYHTTGLCLMGSPAQCGGAGGTPITCTVTGLPRWDDVCGVLQARGLGRLQLGGPAAPLLLTLSPPATPRRPTLALKPLPPAPAPPPHTRAGPPAAHNPHLPGCCHQGDVPGGAQPHLPAGQRVLRQDGVRQRRAAVTPPEAPDAYAQRRQACRPAALRLLRCPLPTAAPPCPPCSLLPSPPCCAAACAPRHRLPQPASPPLAAPAAGGPGRRRPATSRPRPSDSARAN
jgi:hypothetical protein